MTPAHRIVGLGAGGHARVVIEALRASRAGDIVALLDPNRSLWNSAFMGVLVPGDDSLLARLAADGVTGFFVGVGMVRDHRLRRQLFELGLSHGLTPVAAVHPTAIVSPTAVLGAGVALLPGSIVNAAAVVGDNAIVNTGAIVEHDCRVGAHAHIATGATLSGDVHVADGAHVGAGAAIRQGVRIGAAAVVGAGAVVIENVAPGAVVVGVPARPIRAAKDGPA